MDVANIQSLNECKKDSGKSVFYEISEKYNKQNSCESDVDSELIFVIPFNSRVKILSVSVLSYSGFEAQTI